jgi:formate hydrogenlyase subunit 6/NADH:ubiquinone oxidoreductase subunit I
MGTARVKTSLCLTYAAEEREAEACRLCVDRCPYPGEAIRMGEAQGTEYPHPEVDLERCTGCGLCQFACPVAKPAIVVDPRR